MTEPTPDLDTETPERDRLIAALKRHDVALAVIHFDGCGDEGQIDDVSFFKADGAAISMLLTKEAPAAEDGTPTPSLHALHAELEAFAYHTLGEIHGGWEDNDGGYGEITIDVAEGTATLDLNQRIVTTHCTMTEL